MLRPEIAIERLIDVAAMGLVTPIGGVSRWTEAFGGLWAVDDQMTTELSVIFDIVLQGEA